MANRAYLYSTNSIPTKENEGKWTVKGLNENAKYPPYSFMLLASGDTKVCDSVIWNTKNGVVGTYKKGVEQLKKFLSYLKKEIKDNAKEFDSYCEKTLAFLEDKNNQQEYILLEAQEIFDLNTYVNHAKNLTGKGKLYTTPEELVSLIQKFNNDETLKALAKITTDHWKEDVLLDGWSSILYFDFSKKKE
ncbi:MAG: hypothetical protein WA061_05795 [Microgenomates group bacterium]